MCALQRGREGSLRRAGTQSLHPAVSGPRKPATIILDLIRGQACSLRWQRCRLSRLFPEFAAMAALSRAD